MKRLARLARRGRDRDEEGVFLVEGPTLVDEALRSPLAIEGVYVASGSYPEVRARALDGGITVHDTAPGALDRVLSTTTPQPVVAVVAAPDADLASVLEGSPSLVLVLDHLGDPGNVGTLLRSAEAAGAAAAVLGEGTADARQPKAVRASAGAVLRLPVVEHPTAEALRLLGAAGLQRVGAVSSGGRAPEQVDLTRPTALVLGSEAHGLSPATRDRLDELVTVPMVGPTESLNVAAAGAVLLFEAVRQRQVGERATTAVEVISAVSHELRSPLTAIRGFSSLLVDRWDRLDDGERRPMVEEISREALRVTRLVGELLDVSRLESGRLRLQRRLVRLADVVPTVLDRVRLDVPELECTVSIPDDLPRVSADPEKLEQVLVALVENGARHGSPRGLRIDATSDGDEVCVAVRDRGSGLAPDAIDGVFSRTVRREGRRPSGTGLGLWISRGLVEAHGGRLTASSEPGEGCTFVLALPAYQE